MDMYVMMLIPVFFFMFTGINKIMKGFKNYALGDFVIVIGFLLQMIYKETYAGFVVAGLGVVIEMITFFYVAKKNKNKK